MDGSNINESAITAVRDSLLARHGEELRGRIDRGVRQVAALWREEDGDAEAFMEFCLGQFVAEPDLLDATFERLQRNFMLLGGYFTEMRRDLNAPLQLDQGAILPVDYLFGTLSPSAHLSEDLYRSRIAFTVLLNFPRSTLAQRLAEGDGWSRRQWAEARMADRFRTRVPAEVNQALTTAYTNADNYISSYNIVMHNVVSGGERMFPEGLVLISHWGLRDELKAQYAQAEGLKRQRLIQRIMEHIIAQDIPAEVVNNPAVDWQLDDNTVSPAGSAEPGAASPREEDVRYRHWLNIFQAERLLDAHTPDSPTHIARRFDDDREIPEKTVEELFVSILSSP